jgi:hypothetical protein
MRCRLCVFIVLLALPSAARPSDPSACALSAMFASLDQSKITTGILYDRVLPLSHIERFDGTAESRPASLAAWKQVYHELYRSSLGAPPWPPLEAFLARGRSAVNEGLIPVALLNVRYDRIRRDAIERGFVILEDGKLREGEGNPYVEARAFAACALKEYTHRGGRVTFSFDPARYVTNDASAPRAIAVDFSDGTGWRDVALESEPVVNYATAGPKTVRVRMLLGDGSVLLGSFPFLVEHLQTPIPDDTLAVVATIPYAGTYGTGEAYVYRSGFGEALTNPVIVIEGFDIDNTMNWDELYNLLDQEHLVETLHGEGRDLVVLNFTDATDYIQKNAFVIVAAVEQALGMTAAGAKLTLIGASMGGLAARYALAYMEANAIDHGVATFISFDAPQRGADIPLGVQYWMDFFSGESADAAYFLSRLDTPASRQMLVYHHTEPPGVSGTSDPLRVQLLSELAALGQYPHALRMVSVTNGSGVGADQGFAAGEQLIEYQYTSILVDIVGNVWAVPNGTSHIVFDGVIDRIWPLPDDQLSVTVSGTKPYDGAPGGSRASLAQMDATEPPYGDIIALHGSHCFIPTTSSLDIDTDDPFYDIAGDPAIMSHTPFDTIYYPMENQEHVTITSQSAEWFLREIREVLTDVPWGETPAPARVVLYQNFPNPFNPSTMIPFELSEPCHATVSIFDAGGRRVAVLADHTIDAGRHAMSWDGRDALGRPLASGVYFCLLEARGLRTARKMILSR